MFKRCAVIVVLLIAAGDPHSFAAEEPAAAAEKYATHREFLDVECRLLRQMYVDTYHSVGKNDPKFDERATRCIDMSVELNRPQADRAARDDVAKQAQALLKDGCNNPVIHHILAAVLRSFDQYDQAWPHITKARDGYGKNAGVSPTVRMSICLLAFDVQRGRHQGTPYAFAQDLVGSFVPLIVDPVYKDHPRICFDQLQRGIAVYGSNVIGDVYNKIKGNEQVDPWIKQMVAGHMHIRKAWEVRGVGYAHSLSEDRAKGFADNLRKASKPLMHAWELKPDAPESAAAMIEVAFGGGAPDGQTPRFWFDRAVGAQVDFPITYTQMWWAMRRRWGGSHEEMLAFGEECAASKRYDTQIPWVYMDILDEVASETEGGWDTVYQWPGVYERVQKIYDGYRAATPPLRPPAWIMATKASIAWRCGRWDDAVRFLKEVPADFDRYDEVFAAVNGDALRAVGDIKSRMEPHSVKTNVAERLIEKGRYDDALAVYQGAFNEAENDRYIANYYQGQIIKLKWSRDFAAGDWINLTLDKGHAGWTPRFGTWVGAEDGTITGTAEKRGCQLLCDMPVGDRFELTFEFDFDPNYKRFPNAGAFFRVAGPNQDDLLTFFRDRKWIAVASPFHPTGGQTVKTNPAPVEAANNRVHMIVYDGRIWVELNQKMLYEARELGSYGDEPDKSLKFGLGGMTDGPAANYTIKYRNVKLRRVDAPPK